MENRRPIASAAAAAVLVAATVAAFSSAPSAKPAAMTQIAYQTIAPSVFQPSSVVTAWAQQQQEAQVRAHAAALWSGLTALTNQQITGVRLPVFDTWYSPCDVYPAYAANPQNGCAAPPSANSFAAALGARRRQHIATRPLLERPHQFFDTHIVSTPGGVFANVRYNQEMADFVAPYADGTQLDALIGQGKTNLPDPNPHAMMVKPTYALVSGSQPTVLQVWAGPGLQVPPSSTTSTYTPGSTTWTQAVYVVPNGWSGPTPATVPICTDYSDANGNIYASRQTTTANFKVVHLSDFYTLPLNFTQVQALQARASVLGPLRRRAQQRFGTLAQPSVAPSPCPQPNPPNPRQALVAMHVSSAEYPEVWTWQTFWYQPNLTSGLPGTSGPFAHFDVATAYWTVDKATNANRHAFNPFLEAPFGRCVFATNSWPTPSSGASDTPSPCPGSGVVSQPVPSPGPIGNMNLGRTTNCISCHSVATWIKGGVSGAQYVAHDSQPQVPLHNAMLVRNLWSLANNAGPAPSPAPSPPTPRR